jgi:hypothetical protein
MTVLSVPTKSPLKGLAVSSRPYVTVIPSGAIMGTGNVYRHEYDYVAEEFVGRHGAGRP